MRPQKKSHKNSGLDFRSPMFSFINVFETKLDLRDGMNY